MAGGSQPPGNQSGPLFPTLGLVALTRVSPNAGMATPCGLSLNQMEQRRTALGVAIGAGAGVAVGLASGSLVFWLALGAGVGVGIGALLDRQR
jgi:hypothetical protein